MVDQTRAKRSVSALRRAHSEYPRCTAPLSTSTASPRPPAVPLSIALSLFFSHPSFISWDGGRAIVPSADRGKIKRERLKDNFFLINSYKKARGKNRDGGASREGSIFWPLVARRQQEERALCINFHVCFPLFFLPSRLWCFDLPTCEWVDFFFFLSWPILLVTLSSCAGGCGFFAVPQERRVNIREGHGEERGRMEQWLEWWRREWEKTIKWMGSWINQRICESGARLDIGQAV